MGFVDILNIGHFRTLYNKTYEVDNLDVEVDIFSPEVDILGLEVDIF